MMSEEVMIVCDNPKCKNTGRPEWLPEKGSRKKGHTGPYGWMQCQIGWVGRGPYFEIDVCSLDCLTPAVDTKYEEELHNGRA
jgi:hypothetical protein